MYSDSCMVINLEVTSFCSNQIVNRQTRALYCMYQLTKENYDHVDGATNIH